MLLIIGNGTVGSSFGQALQSRGMNADEILTYDTEPARSKLDREGVLGKLLDLDLVFCCVDTPILEKRTRPEEHYNLVNVLDCVSLLIEGGFEGLLVMRTTISPKCYALLEDTIASLGARFSMCVYPAILKPENPLGDAFQPVVSLVGITEHDQRLAALEDLFKEFFPDVIIVLGAVANALLVAQIVSVQEVALRTLYTELHALWQSLSNNVGPTFTDTLQVILKAQLFSDVTGFYDPRRPSYKGACPSEATEDLAAIAWCATMQEVYCPAIQGLHRSVVANNKALSNSKKE